MNPIRPAPLAAALALALALCAVAHAAPPEAPAPSAAPASAAQPGSGIDKSAMDTQVRPQDDFFRYANGGWLKNAIIPADKSSTGLVTLLRDQSDERIRGIIEALAKTPQPAGSVNQKIADFYNAYMDTAAIDKAGLAPLQPYFAAIDAVKDRRSLANQMARWASVINVPLALDNDVDAKNPDAYIPVIVQAGLGMPDRDYFLLDDPRFSKTRAAYEAYVGKLLALSGDAHAAADAAKVVALEKRIAAIQWSRVDNRDPIKRYNPTTLKALAASLPGVDWAAFVKAGEMPVPDKISLFQPSYVKGLVKLMGEVPIATWKTYLRVRVLDDASSMLPAEFREARFEFRGRALAGLTQDRPRWQRAIAFLDSAMGEALGQVYVDMYFPAAYKARMKELVGNLFKAYGSSIDNLTWMGPATKSAAHEKLSKYITKIGYPDAWRDYARLDVRAGDPVGNAFRASRFEYLRQAARIGSKVDRGEWFMTPQTVNAYYNPSFNEIVFPAAFLQPPIFDMTADDAYNYGGVGAVIGHEISHGFDDGGSRYDGDGKLRDWWTADDRKAFDAITSRLVEQFNQYEPLQGKKVNGKLTLGENIADLSGLQIAYKAWKLSLNGKPSPVIDGFTGEQRFFIGYAQYWRDKWRDELMLQIITSDPHAPDEFRANGGVINHDAFQETFGTKPGDGMYKAPADRIRLW